MALEHGLPAGVGRRPVDVTCTVKSCDVAASSEPSGEKSTAPWKNEHPVTFSSSPPNDGHRGAGVQIGDVDRVVPDLGPAPARRRRWPAAGRSGR